MNGFSSPAETDRSAPHTQNSHKLTRKRYLRLIDQQLTDLEARIGHLRAKERSLEGPAQDRLSGNVRMLAGKLHEARSLWKQVGTSGDEWLTLKKQLDAKVIHLQKSLTYVKNHLS